MSDILSKLYHGNMQPSTSTQWHNEEFEKNRKEYMELEKELVDSLGKESLELFFKFCESSDKLLTQQCEMNFKEGFLLSGKLFTEVLTQKDLED